MTSEEEKTNAEKLKEMFSEKIGVAMYIGGLCVRDACVQLIRQFGGRVSNEELANIIERIPLPGKEE